MKKSVGREYYEAILVAFILALFVRTYLFENFKIPSGSMKNNLLIGDHLVVNKFIFAQNKGTFLHRLLPYRAPQRGDVVVFKYPEDPRRDFIKRCVAVGGDRVEIRSKRLLVNGVEQDEPYVFIEYDYVYEDSPRTPVRDRMRDHMRERIVPEGTIFCLGDNRDNSLDSRFWGPVPLENIKGRAVLIYWSWEADAADHQWKGPLHRLKQIAKVIIFFFPKTRWERQFRLIR